MPQYYSAKKCIEIYKCSNITQRATRSYLQDAVYIISWNKFYDNVYKKEEIINIVNEWEMISLSILIYFRQNTVIMNYASILITTFHSILRLYAARKVFSKK